MWDSKSRTQWFAVLLKFTSYSVRGRSPVRLLSGLSGGSWPWDAPASLPHARGRASSLGHLSICGQESCWGCRATGALESFGSSALPNNVWVSRNFTPSSERKNQTQSTATLLPREHSVAWHKPSGRPGRLLVMVTLNTPRESWGEKQFHLWNYTPLFSFILISTFKE